MDVLCFSILSPGDSLGQPFLLKPGSVTAGYSGSCHTAVFLISARMEISQPQQASCSSIQPPSQNKKRFFLCLNGISCISVCTHCTSSCHWATLRRVRLCLLYSSPSDIYIHWEDPPEHSFLSRFSLHMTDAPSPSSPLWPFAGLPPTCPSLSCTKEPRTGHKSPDVSHESWAGDKDHLPRPAGDTLFNAVQGADGLLGSKGALLANRHYAVHPAFW